MNTPQKCRKLAGEIASYFEDGIYIDAHTRAYIDTCFPDISFREIVDRVCTKPDCDDAPLLELIFFPDEAIQMRLEPLLQKHIFSIEDENEVARLLIETGIRTTLRETESNSAAPLNIPVLAIAPFVRRLNIHRRIPPELIENIHEIFPTTEADRLKVALRNTRFAFSPQIIDFLVCFFRGTDPSDENFRACLGLTLTLLDEPKHESDPYFLLNAKYDQFIRAKEAAAEFTRQLRHSNMETLMHYGIRAPEIGIEEAERKIELLEQIMEATKSGTTPL